MRIMRKNSYRHKAMSLVSCGILLGILSTPLAALAEGKQLTLDEALAKAKQNHPGLRASRAETTATKAQVGEAFSGYLPRLDSFAQYQRSTGNWMPTPGMTSVVQGSATERENRWGFEDTVNYVTFGTVLTQPIYDFGKTGSKVDAAHAQDSVAQANMKATEDDVEVGVRVAYYGVLAAQQALLVAEETRQNQARHVEQIRQFVTAGSRAKYDRVSAELKLDDADLAVLRAQNGLRTARVRLNNAMGQSNDIEYVVTESVSVDAFLEQQDSKELMETAQVQRPELTKSKAQIALRRADHDSAWAGYFPDLVATGSLGGAKVDDLNTGFNWYLGVGLNWRVFEGLRTYRRSESTAALSIASEAEHDRLLQSVQSEIKIQLMAIDEAKKRQKVAEHAVEIATERLRLAEGRYEAGAGSVLELEDAQVSQMNARFQSVQSSYDVSVARILLRRAVGI